jgi:LCP family protein required for cell wall assembly
MRGFGRAFRALLVALVVCCGATFALYLIFPPSPIYLVVMGIDARPGEGKMARTDAIILFGVRPSRWQVAMLSIPRDLFIPAPNYGLQRVNVIHLLGEMEREGGGPALLTQSLNDSLDVRLNRYLRLNFTSFVSLIDALGGIEIDVEKPIRDVNYPTEDYGVQTVVFQAGKQTMDGARALIYARTRQADDDFSRARRQQQIVNAVAQKMLNPTHWGIALEAMNSLVDTDMSLFDVLAVAPVLVARMGQYEALVIDREFIRAGARGALPDYDKLAPWLEAHFRD